MRIKKTKKEIKEVEVTVSDVNLCDKCGKDLDEDISDMYEVFECNFEYKTGESYPEGGDIHYTELELCKKCGKEAIQLLKDNGFVFTERDSNW